MTVTDPQFETVSESKARLTAFCPLEIVTLYADEAPLDEHCLAKAQRDLTRLLKFRFPKASDNEIENIVKKASDAMRNNPLACSNLYAQTCGSPLRRRCPAPKLRDPSGQVRNIQEEIRAQPRRKNPTFETLSTSRALFSWIWGRPFI